MKLATILPLAAVLAVVPAYSQEDESVPADEVADTPAETAAEGGGEAVAPRPKVKFFATLPFCRQIVGTVEVRRPDSAAWEPVEENVRYALGTSFRTGSGARMTLTLGTDCNVRINGDSEFATRPQPLGEDVRSIVVRRGSVKVVMPRNLPAGGFSIAAPGFTLKDIAGECRVDYTPTGDGDEAVVACATGTFVVEGRNFTVPRMNPTQEFKIRTSHDNLVTILYGLRGDTVVNVSRGVVMRTEIDEDGKVQHVAETPVLEWRLSPGTRVQINRAVPAIGEKMSVSVLTFGADGALKNHFAYVEGLAAVNSGELVAASKEESDKLAKRAAEAAGDAAEAEGNASGADDGASDDNNNESEEE